MPVTANLVLREFGIALFFAVVGLAAGPKFSATFSAQMCSGRSASLGITTVCCRLPVWSLKLQLELAIHYRGRPADIHGG
jgi:putative transport protein